MRKLRALWIRFNSLFRSRRTDDDFTAELESHVALHTDEGIRASPTASAAHSR